MKKAPIMIQTNVLREGQRFVDDPILVKPVKRTTMQQALEGVFGRSAKERRPICVGYERVPLRWLEPK